jgi:hypothetical protein
VVRLGVADVVASDAEGVGEQSAAGAVLGLGEHENVIIPRGEPVQLASGALG